MLDTAGGVIIAAITILTFLGGAELAVEGDGRYRIPAITSGILLMLASAAFAVWVVVGR